MTAEVIKKPKNRREQFSALAREHHLDLLVYARVLSKQEHVSRDLVQESFVAAWNNWDKFDVTRDFGSWMRGIIRNKWREWIRREKRTVSMDEETLEALELEMAEWQSHRQDGGPSVFIQLESCLKQLPEALNRAVKECYYGGFATEEAAQRLGLNGATVRKRLERARGALKQCLENGVNA